MFGEDRSDEKHYSNYKKIDEYQSNENKIKTITSRNIFNPRLSKKHFSKRHLNNKRNTMTGTEKKDDTRSMISSSQTVPLKSVRIEENKNNDVEFEKKFVLNLNKIKNSKNLVKIKDEKKKIKIKEFEGKSAKFSSKYLTHRS